MPKSRAKRRSREPDVTRKKLLEAAFEEMHLRGFQAAGIDTILAKARVAKGALYHHFRDKASLGYAVVDEVIRDKVLADIIGPLEASSNDPVTAMQGVLRRKAARVTADGLPLGCPLNNLAQEMSPLDERFRKRVNAAFDIWRDAFAHALERGQAAGSVRTDVYAKKVAAFVVASIEGSIGQAKNVKSLPLLRSNLEVLSSFLDTLRPATTR